MADLRGDGAGTGRCGAGSSHLGSGACGEPNGALADRLSLLYGTSGFPASGFNYSAGVPSAESVASADFDGDGVAELAVGGTGAAQVSIAAFVDNSLTRTRALAPKAFVNVPGRVANIVRGDFNRDGKPDLAVAVIGGVKVLANRSTPGNLQFEPIPAGNALLLANRHFRKHPNEQPVLLIVTDGEPTSHLEPGGSVFFDYPPHPRTLALAVRELDAAARLGAQTTFFRLGEDPGLARFVDAMARRAGGKVVTPELGDLGAAVVGSYLGGRAPGAAGSYRELFGGRGFWAG